MNDFLIVNNSRFFVYFELTGSCTCRTGEGPNPKSGKSAKVFHSQKKSSLLWTAAAFDCSSFLVFIGILSF